MKKLTSTEGHKNMKTTLTMKCNANTHCLILKCLKLEGVDLLQDMVSSDLEAR